MKQQISITLEERSDKDKVSVYISGQISEVVKSGKSDSDRLTDFNLRIIEFCKNTVFYGRPQVGEAPHYETRSAALIISNG